MNSSLFLSSFLKRGIALIFSGILLSGCASEALRDNTVETGSTTTDIAYEMALSNIAMIRYFKHADVLPWDLQLHQGLFSVNDSGGITPGGTFGSAHGIIAPTVMIPMSRATQQQWTVNPSNSILLLTKLQVLYKAEEKTDSAIYHDGIPPLGSLSGEYRDWQVWVDPDKPDDMSTLTMFVRNVLGSLPAKHYDGLSDVHAERIIKCIDAERTKQAAAAQKTDSSIQPNINRVQ